MPHSKCDPSDDSWEGLYERLKQFRQERGHLRVPENWPEDIPLAAWVRQQHTIHSQLASGQVERLLKIGFNFGRRDTAWYKRFFDLRDFVAEHRRLPRGHMDLAPWLEYQRIRRIEGNLSLYRIRWLDVLGMRWERRHVFNERFAELEAFRAKHGHCMVPFWNVPEYRGLGNYVANTLRRKKHTLSPQEVHRLDELGFVWNPQDDRWNRRYLEFKRFQERFGHDRVPADKPEFQQLWKWIQFQKRRRDRMPASRREQLDALGFKWAIERPPPPTRQRMELLERFYETHGHCNVTITDDRDLALWLTDVRSRKKMSASMSGRLQAMNIDWTPAHSAWEQRFQELAAFRKKQGHCRMPWKWTENPGLAQWVRGQKTRHNNGTLSAERKRRLDKLGLDWGQRGTNPTGAKRP